MINFAFNYQGNEIQYTVDLLGREKVLLNNEVIAKPTNWFKSVVQVQIKVGDELLNISRRLVSYTEGEYQVTLANEDKIIDKQTKLAIEMNPSGEETVYKGDEMDWLKEINVPQHVFNFAWVLYFLIIGYSFSMSFGSEGIATLAGWGVVTLAGGSILVFLK